MRIVHTADWHVGKTLQGRSRLDEHERVLDEIVELTRREGADLVIVAGDLFDSSSPPPEAERIVYDTLLRLSTAARTIVIAGNHDNDRRLAAVAPLFDLAGVAMRPFIARDGRPLEIETRAGERARVAVLPWVSQRHVVKAEALMTADADELGGRFAERMRRIIARLCEPFARECVNLLVGHVTVAGSEMGGGERLAQTIFDYWVDATAFPSNAHYVALGHMHRMQPVPAACPVYYSGSPLQLDFSERDDPKGVLVVDAAPTAPARARAVELSTGRRLRTIEGTLAQLRAIAGTTGTDFLRVRVREPARAGLGDEVRHLFPEAVKVIVESAEPRPETARAERASSPRDLFAEYLAARDLRDDRMVALFQELYEECAA